MSSGTARYVEEPTLSDGWLGALAAVAPVRGRKVVHLVVRIADPEAEDPAVRGEAQRLIDGWNAAHPSKPPLWDVETTRNTIFPASMAARHPEPADLAARYRSLYDRDGLRGFTQNSKGTYFGRIVAHPRALEDWRDKSVEEARRAGPVDQLTETVAKLRNELSKRSTKSSCYELNVYNASRDRGRIGFPCLAHVSVHVHEERLHMQAVYRNEWLVARAYGNFLGLAELQRYAGAAAGIPPGELLMTINHAELDCCVGEVKRLLRARGRLAN